MNTVTHILWRHFQRNNHRLKALFPCLTGKIGSEPRLTLTRPTNGHDEATRCHSCRIYGVDRLERCRDTRATSSATTFTNVCKMLLRRSEICNINITDVVSKPPQLCKSSVCLIDDSSRSLACLNGSTSLCDNLLNPSIHIVGLKLIEIVFGFSLDSKVFQVIDRKSTRLNSSHTDISRMP